MWNVQPPWPNRRHECALCLFKIKSGHFNILFVFEDFIYLTDRDRDSLLTGEPDAGRHPRDQDPSRRQTPPRLIHPGALDIANLSSVLFLRKDSLTLRMKLDDTPFMLLVLRIWLISA